MAREDVQQEGRRLLGQDPADHFGAVVVPLVAHHVPQGPDRAGAGLPHPEHHPGHPGEHERGKHLLEQADDGAAATVDPAVNPADRPGAVGEDPGPGASLEALLTENDRTPL